MTISKSNELKLLGRTVKLSFNACKIQEKIDSILTASNLMDYDVKLKEIEPSQFKHSSINYTYSPVFQIDLFGQTKQHQISFFFMRDNFTIANRITVHDGNGNVAGFCDTEDKTIVALDKLIESL